MSAEGSTDFGQWDSHDIDFSVFLRPYTSNSNLHINQPGRIEGLSVHNTIAILPQDPLPLTIAETTSSATCDISGIASNDSRSKINKIYKKPKRPSSKKTLGNQGAPEPGSVDRGRPRKHTTVSLSRFNTDGTTENEKRVQFLERNRLAASKCRGRKKLWTSKLEEQARVLATQRHAIANQITLLRHELLELKFKCLDHSDCACEQIRQYLINTITSVPTESLSDELPNSYLPELSSGSGSMSSPVSNPTSESPLLDMVQDPVIGSFAELESGYTELQYDAFDLFANQLQQGKHDNIPTRSVSSKDLSAIKGETLDT
jgi:hypothetical protein